MCQTSISICVFSFLICFCTFQREIDISWHMEKKYFFNKISYFHFFSNKDEQIMSVYKLQYSAILKKKKKIGIEALFYRIFFFTKAISFFLKQFHFISLHDNYVSIKALIQFILQLILEKLWHSSPLLLETIFILNFLFESNFYLS